MPWKSTACAVAVALSATVLSGCVSNPVRSYGDELNQAKSKIESRRIGEAIADLDKNNQGDKDLLFHFEKGYLLRLSNQFDNSRQEWLKADEKVRLWEEEAKLNPEKVLSAIASVIVNDKMMRYDGQDYEKVMLSAYLALDHILLGEWDKARTEIKKMHEREAIIAEIRAKEIEKVEAEAKEREVKTEFKELQGYPVETLNDPEVTKLKNSYQSAFSHYLAGFVYEALGEPSLAAPGYRKAIELRPGIKALEDGLKNLGTQARNGQKLVDTLFVVESGHAPGRKSVTIPVPIKIEKQLAATPLSFPVIDSDSKQFQPDSLRIGGASLKLSSITNFDTMARRALKDEMPGIILRTTLRAVAKTAIQKEAKKKGGEIGGLIATIGAIATESADERGWRTLPKSISIVRTRLPAGKHLVEIPTAAGMEKTEINLVGTHAVVPIRVTGPAVYVAQSASAFEGSVAAAAAPVMAQTEEEGAGTKKAATKKSAAGKKKPQPGI